MEHPLIDFDISAAREALFEVCERDPDPRSKPLVAVLRGAGGGKTRTTVDLWLDLNSQPNVLAVAITFNHNWTVNAKEISHYSTKPDATNPEARANMGCACYVHMLIARMASVFFGNDIGAIQLQLNYQAFVSLAQENPLNLLRSFVSYLVLRIQRKITHFVLLVDETAAGDDFVRKHYELNDVTSTLRNGMLDSSIFKPNTKDVLHVGLVMTSLEITPIGRTLSNRSVVPLHLPQVLSPELIIEQWWSKKSSKFSPTVLNIAASVFASVPRVVQVAAFYLPKSSTFEELIHKVCTDVNTRYTGLVLPRDPNLLHALIFKEEVKLSEDIMYFIKRSIFVNSLTSFEEETKIVPESNLVMLMAAARNSPRTVFGDLVSKMLTFGPLLDQAGDALEVLLYRWMNLRIAVFATSQPTKEITLATLLQFHEVMSPISLVEQTVKGGMLVADLNDDPKRLSYSSRTQPKEFEKEIAGLLAKGQVQIYLSSKGDAFDFLLLFGKWLLFFDAKSRDEEEKTSATVTKTWSAQAEYLTSFIGGCSSWTTILSGWYYIYFTTHAVHPSVKRNVISVGRSVVESFFGPLWPCYRAFRSEWNKPAKC
jgi:hypothetical protein